MNHTASLVEEHFLAALEIEESDARSSFLDRVCVDTEVRERIDRLLALDARADGFLECPPSIPTMTAPPIRLSDWPATVVGRYEILKPIGEGGMGIVYLAEQTAPVRREVALKVIKPGMDTRQIIARFEAERQALAIMDHPNIARVLDGGATESGLPYFVMELVRGEPITSFCDSRRISIRDRLDLFVLVCRAVQHAHQKGVIHRDLKPSNILVTVVDGVAVPKVIDFGVAKATGQSLTERTLFTDVHQFVGTPLYMSPEQADRDGGDVDTRSDIYSLGVVLYELLTGTTPFDRETLKRAPIEELRRIVREEEPPNPRTRLNSLGASLIVVSARRGVAPWQLNRAVRDDLNWVVMKALEKDRRRRYETVDALAADVLRYLSDQPVEAMPPSLQYRLAKLVCRNRGWLSIAAVVMLTMLVATGVSTSQALRARNAEARAEHDFRQARDTIDRVIVRVSDELKNVPGAVKSRRAVLEDALAFYQGFLAAHAEDTEVKFDAARAELRVASIRKQIGELDAVESHIRLAIELLEQLNAASPLVADYRAELAEAHNALGEILHAPRGLEQRRAALALYEGLVTDYPLDPVYRRRLAGLHCNLGLAMSTEGVIQFAEAETHLRAALTIWTEARDDFPGMPEEPMELARFHHWMGNLLAQTAREHEAETEYRRSLALLEAMAAGAPAGPELVERIAHVKSYLATLQMSRGLLAESEQLLREVIVAMEPLWRVFPEIRGYTQRLGTAYQSMAFSFWKSGRRAEAELMLTKSLGVWNIAAEQHRGSSVYLDGVAHGLRNLGVFLNEIGRPQDTFDVFQRVIAVQETLAGQNPDSGKHLAELAWWLSICPVVQLRDPARAAVLAERAVKLDPSSPVFMRVLGVARYRRDDLPSATLALNRALELDPHDGPAALFLAMIHARQGSPVQALAWHAKGIQTPDTWYPSARLNRLFSAEAIELIDRMRISRD